MRVFLTCLAVVACLEVLAERQPYSRYESIVDRQMFGPLPDGFDPSKPPSEAVSSRAAQKTEQELSREQQKLKSSIRFSMINVTPSGETAVGFTDSSEAKSPKNYYLKVGETRDGWTVQEADAAKGTMTIVKDGVEVSLGIGENSAKGGGKTAVAGGDGPSRRNGSSLSMQGNATSLSARRNQRRAEESARLDEQRKQLLAQQAAFEKRQQEDAARREEDKAQQEAQREEQRKQLMAIQEELKRTREENLRKAEEAKAESDESQTQDQ